MDWMDETERKRSIRQSAQHPVSTLQTDFCCLCLCVHVHVTSIPSAHCVGEMITPKRTRKKNSTHYYTIQLEVKLVLWSWRRLLRRSFVRDWQSIEYYSTTPSFSLLVATTHRSRLCCHQIVRMLYTSAHICKKIDCKMELASTLLDLPEVHNEYQTSQSLGISNII